MIKVRKNLRASVHVCLVSHVPVVRECGISHAYRPIFFQISKSFVWQPYRAIDYAVAIMLSLPRCHQIYGKHLHKRDRKDARVTP